jgi:hypothetical protein
MKMQSGKMARTGALLGLGLALFACNPDDPNKLLGGPAKDPGKNPCPVEATGPGSPTSSGTGGAGGGTTGGGNKPPTALDERSIDYNEALRTASLKLVGSVPTLDQIETVRVAADQKKAYEDYVDQYLASPRFASAMVEFWRNTFRSGSGADPNAPNREGAPNFAAKITVNGEDYRQLFTAQAGTCPTFDAATGAFTPADCPNGALPTAGVLTDAGLMFQYASALAFRRVRFVQETFACRKMPAEWSPNPVTLPGGGSYTSPWPFDTIGDSTKNTGRIAFQDTTAAICANCHTTMNHRAPLFAVFDDTGTYQPPVDLGGGNFEFSVIVPVEGSPKANFTDYLLPTETTAWKHEKPAATLRELGDQMAQDDEVARCAVVRVWNYAFSKGDAVYDLADVPDSVIGPLVEQFKTNYNLRDIIRAAFVHPDFVEF